jgi:hypothetical protein
MVTVYDVKTGDPVSLEAVDAKDWVRAGLAVRDPEELKKAPAKKTATKKAPAKKAE